MLRKSVGAENGNWKSFTQKVAENDVENVCVEMESGKWKVESGKWKVENGKVLREMLRENETWRTYY